MTARVLKYTLILRHPETDAPTAVLVGEPVPKWAKDLVHEDDLESGSAKSSDESDDGDAAEKAAAAEAAAKAAAEAEEAAKAAAEKAEAIEAEAKAAAEKEAAEAAAAGHPVGDPSVNWKSGELDAYASAKSFDISSATNKQEKVDAIAAAAAAAESGN